MNKVLLALLFLFGVTNLQATKVIEVNLSTQKIYAKENGRVVFSGSVSSGRAHRRTPDGTFRVLEKDRFHISSKYPAPHGGAKMPYMHRITKGGIAIHKGYLPGYPASHGCIRVSMATAKKLWHWSHVGVRVKVFGDASNFHYVKKKRKKRYVAKRKSSKKKYAKKRVYTKRKYARKKYTKRHVYKKSRYVKRRRARRYSKYAQRDRNKYEVVEVYDSW